MELAHANRSQRWERNYRRRLPMKSSSRSRRQCQRQSRLELAETPTAKSEGGPAGARWTVKDRQSSRRRHRWIRALVRKVPPRKEALEISGVILEVIALTRGKMVKNGFSVQTHLADGLSLIQGDRVNCTSDPQLHLNAVDALSVQRGGARVVHRHPAGRCTERRAYRGARFRGRACHHKVRPRVRMRSTRPKAAAWVLQLLLFDHRSSLGPGSRAARGRNVHAL